MYNIINDIENEIIDAINVIIDEYLQGRTAGTRHARSILTKKDYDLYFDGKKRTIYDAKKEFLDPKNLSKLIEDIKWAGYISFVKISGISDSKLNEQRYKDLVRKLLNEIIRDRIALEKDKFDTMKVEKLETFSQKIYEVKLPVMKLDEIVDDVTLVTNDTLKRVLVSYYKTHEDYIDLVDKKKHLFKVHDMTGDILNNSRVSFDVCIFEKQDVERIKNNLVDFSIGEFHRELPNTLNIFGVNLKPSSFINKDELKSVFEQVFTIQEVTKIIESILGWKLEGLFNDFYIWSNRSQITVK